MKWLIAILLIPIIALSSCSNQSDSRNDNTPENGELNNAFIDQNSTVELTPEQEFQIEKDKLLSEGWEEQNIFNGQLPECYNYKPQKGAVDNSLDVYVGSGTDVAIKVVNAATDICIRYVFINSGSNYSISNIPEGRYYLKIAYGKNWFSKVENGKCIGKFIRNPMYEKGEDVMDFNLQYTNSGYNIPSFRLHLDVVSSDISNSFDSQNISENEFNL